MNAQSSGRRTESLFDNRYRYDHIYPRGRSGETLRAYDTQNNDYPVVIKRPAPQDAPPMRAGQEVSIRTEKQALQRLAGHPVLTELRASGTFRVGGHTHEYIVMDLAQGQIVENMVLECAKQGEYLPELETLVIIDALLDLLDQAHNKQVVYNDVDAKHLFWNRTTYRLMIIDWGNAVFLDEPGALPNVTRATDIYQVGELLYFILTGGNRLAVEAEDGDTFFVNFGPDAERIPARLQTILTRAVHPDSRRRYGTILELRHALADCRQPLEKTRDDILARVRKRVRATASQEELEELEEALHVALDMDPGYPEAGTLMTEIQFHLNQIRVQADLDAIRIYIESENWTRAHALLHDLLPQADPVNEPLLRFLITATATLEERPISPPPAGFMQALAPLFQGDAPAAGQALLLTSEARAAARQTQWLLAEQLTLHITAVALLRPHLVRLQHELNGTPNADSALATLHAVDAKLARSPVPGLTGLLVIYQQVAALLNQLETTLETLDEDQQKTALASTIRAQRATQTITTRLEEIGQYVYSDPGRASDLLHQTALIDPTSPHFTVLHDYFDEVHQAIQALNQFKPQPDGANLAGWLADVQDFVQPYLEDLPDSRLHAAVNTLDQTAAGWHIVVNYLALGRRQPTIRVLRETAELIRPLNEHIAACLGNLANRLPDIQFVEHLSSNENLAHALVDGWKAWDRGDAFHAAELGRTAHTYAVTDGERLAADRLHRLSNLLDHWLAENGPQDLQRTDQAEAEALSILLAEEERERQTFAEQMPNTATYLRAMERGIVLHMQHSSSAGWRALYLHYVLRGMLALLHNTLEEADFWRDVAHKSFENTRTHRAFQVLDRALTGRHLVHNAQQTMNAVSGPNDLETVRQALNAPLTGEILSGAEEAVQQADEALRHWSDGDFYAARQALDFALENIQRAIETAHLQIEPFVTWLTTLRDTTADLHQTRLNIEQNAVMTNIDPDPSLEKAHVHIVSQTIATLGPEHVHQVRQWEDMYQAVLETYTTQRMVRREKLAAFDRHFASLFISRHPAYPLFQHWRSVIEQLPPDELEDDMILIDDVLPGSNQSGLTYMDDETSESVVQTEGKHAASLPWNWIIGIALLLLITIAGLAVLRTMNNNSNNSLDNTRLAPTERIALVPANADTPTQSNSPNVPSHTPRPGATTSLPSRVPPTKTPVPPTASPTSTTVPPTATITPTTTVPPTDNPAPSPTPTPFMTSTFIPSATPEPVIVLPVAGTNQDILVALAEMPIAARPDGPSGAFAPDENGTWRISTANSERDVVSLDLSPDLLGSLFQPGAANTFRRADVILELVEYDQTALSNGEVAFGLGAANTNGQHTIGQVQFIAENFVSVGLNQNDQFRSSSQFPQQNPQMSFSVRRTNANTLSFYVDEKWLGDSVFLFTQGEPVTLILYATGQAVIVDVLTFDIDFSPRDEIP